MIPSGRLEMSSDPIDIERPEHPPGRVIRGAVTVQRQGADGDTVESSTCARAVAPLDPAEHRVGAVHRHRNAPLVIGRVSEDELGPVILTLPRMCQDGGGRRGCPRRSQNPHRHQKRVLGGLVRPAPVHNREHCRYLLPVARIWKPVELDP